MQLWDVLGLQRPCVYAPALLGACYFAGPQQVVISPYPWGRGAVGAYFHIS